MLDQVTRYDEWLRRAQSPEAPAVLDEIGRLLDDAGLTPAPHLAGSAQDAAARARLQYLAVIAHYELGEVDAAAVVADLALENARRSESVGLVALTLSTRAGLVAQTRGLSHGLELYQQAERLLVGTPAGALEHPDWVAALIDMWVTASTLGLHARARELSRSCRALPAGAATPYERYAIAQNTAEDMLWDALRPARRPPYEADAALLDGALALAGEATAAAPEPVPMDANPQAWRAVVGAYAGDADEAADVLGRLLAERTAATLHSLEPAMRAARLRALRRAGRLEEARRTSADETRLITTLSELPGPPEALATYLWERAACSSPALADAGSNEGQLALFHERQAAEHERVVQSLLDLHLTNLELELRQTALTDMTRMDELTGVLNRRGMQPHLERCAADPRGRAWALLLVDVDGFKSVNDSLGHVAADELLQLLGAALRRASRAEDVVARIGGDEFLVLADTTPEDPGLAAAIGDRIRSTVRRLDTSGLLRVSVGVSVRTGPVEANTWMSAADRAMYAAKRGGGDRVSEALPADAPLR